MRRWVLLFRGGVVLAFSCSFGMMIMKHGHGFFVWVMVLKNECLIDCFQLSFCAGKAMDSLASEANQRMALSLFARFWEVLGKRLVWLFPALGTFLFFSCLTEGALMYH